MINEKQNSWTEKLDAMDGLPGEPAFDKEAAWEKLQAKSIELQALLVKHGILLLRSDPNNTLELKVEPLNLTHQYFEFIFDQDSHPRQG